MPVNSEFRYDSNIHEENLCKFITYYLNYFSCRSEIQLEGVLGIFYSRTYESIGHNQASVNKKKKEKKDNQKNKPPQKHRQPCFNLIAATSGTLMQS